MLFLYLNFILHKINLHHFFLLLTFLNLILLNLALQPRLVLNLLKLSPLCFFLLILRLCNLLNSSLIRRHNRRFFPIPSSYFLRCP
mmetsp:Transcript_2633/g.312  ORF Transcript_2633/g.312 Transcript_2633/m.312 type:complete len:86 (+) Transcript_2633:134-391(+)